MRITYLRVRNLFGLKEFDSKLENMELVGKKGAGKSSLIDAIKLALSNKSDREYIIMNGETEGEVFIQTDTGLSVHRKIRTNKADYKSIRQEGEKGDKNESFLREIYTELQLNPIEFSKMNAQDQNRIILDLIDFKWDMNWIKDQFGEIPSDVNYEQNILNVLHDIQAKEGKYFLTREGFNRDARNKQAQIEDIGKTLPAGYDAKKWEEANLGALYKQIESIRTKNEAITLAKSMVQGRDNRIKEFQAELNLKNSEIERESVQSINDYQANINTIEQEIMAEKFQLEKVVSDIDKNAIQEKHDLEQEIRELEDKIKSRRQEIIDITPRVNARISEANKFYDGEIFKLKEKLNLNKTNIITIESEKDHSLESAQKTYEANISGIEGEVKQHEELSKQELIQFESLQEEAETVEKMKLHINEYKKMLTLTNEVASLNSKSELITAKIGKARTLPGEILEKSNVPIPGLTIKDGIPLINGLPISNLSDGERFELCVNLAATNANSLQLILLNGIECLPEEDRDKLYASLKARGVQFIASRTTSDNELKVVEL